MRTAEFGAVPQRRTPIVAIVLLALSSCALFEPTTAPIGPTSPELSADIDELGELVAAARTDVETLRKEQTGDINDLKRDLARIRSGVVGLPAQISTLCVRPTSTPTNNCENDSVRTVEVSGNKMVVGQLEHIWVDPPGISLTGRIDTGTTSNLLRVDALGGFERDGDDWVRFSLRIPGEQNEGPVTIEREVSRYSRTSTRRPVVKLRLRLGDVLDSFEFILVDRSDNDHAVLLGRNFLKDVALVDVGRQYVQGQFRPKKSAKTNNTK